MISSVSLGCALIAFLCAPTVASAQGYAEVSPAAKQRQLTQVDIASLLYSDRTAAPSAPGMGYGWINETATRELIAAGVGSIFNSPSSGEGTAVPPPDWWRRLNTFLWNASVEAGSVPVLYGLDSIHGATYIFNSTLFPQQVGCAATFNRSVAHTMGIVSGRETRYAGIPWVFSPVLGIAMQPTWARVYETFGEDPLVAAEMGAAVIRGYQTPLPPPFAGASQGAVAACAKHFVGYPDMRTGRDRTPSWTPINVLLQYFAPPFAAAVRDAGVRSIMENYIEVNGRPTVANPTLLQTLLRDVMKFDGMLVTDYNEVWNLATFHKYSANLTDAVLDAFGSSTSLDMSMTDGQWYWPNTGDLVREFETAGKVASGRVNVSAARVLGLKQWLGLVDKEGKALESPVPPEQTAWSGEGCLFGCDEHREAALDAARQSMTLLVNAPNATTQRGWLPLDASNLAGRNVAVIGAGCAAKSLLSGGWTVHWQGTSNETAFPTGDTVFGQLQSRLGPLGANVTWVRGCDVAEGPTCLAADVAAAVAVAAAADVTVMCVGERHYAEKPGDITDLTLPGGQAAMIDAVVAATGGNVAVVLVEGRPRTLPMSVLQAKAVLHAYLPGPYGGEAIVDVLLGAYNPAGRLPYTYPAATNTAPAQYFRKPSANTGGDYAQYTSVMWPFGAGLSYSAFQYTAFEVTAPSAAAGGEWYVARVTVTNVGPRDSDEVVLLMASQAFRHLVTPEVEMLRNFTRVHVRAGQSASVELSFHLHALRAVDEYRCEWVDVTAPLTLSVAGSNGQGVEASVPAYDAGAAGPMPINGADCALWAAHAAAGAAAAGVVTPTAAPTTDVPTAAPTTAMPTPAPSTPSKLSPGAAAGIAAASGVVFGTIMTVVLGRLFCRPPHDASAYAAVNH